MHGHVDPAEFMANIAGFLGGYYLCLAIMNAVAAFYLWQSGRGGTLFKIGVAAVTTAHLWLAAAVVFTIMSAIAMSGSSGVAVVSLPASVRDAVDWIMGPVVYSVGSLLLLAVMFLFRRFFVQPTVAWAILNLALLLMGLSMTDPDFAAIVTKADNVPIVGLVFLLGFFTWLSAAKAVKNDDRLAAGEPPLEKNDNEKVLVWPDLVYTELICMVALTAFLLVWAIGLQAPLEEPASAVKTPNPSKAPWYFLGLQEMLVYFDPWMAGVVLPSLVLVGLAAIPFLDFNQRGNGYYTINERKFAYVMFQFGFLVLWITLIVLGTFLRGPNWNFFGPYETWDAHKVEAMNNVDLSQYFWNIWLQRSMPAAAPEAGAATKFIWIVVRELPGLILVGLYFVVLPPALVLLSGPMRGLFARLQQLPVLRTRYVRPALHTVGEDVCIFDRLFIKMGFIRYMVLIILLLFMMLLPIKMVLRWMFDLKYLIALPEYRANF